MEIRINELEELHEFEDKVYELMNEAKILKDGHRMIDSLQSLLSMTRDYYDTFKLPLWGL